jgi:hypothetical protein
MVVSTPRQKEAILLHNLSADRMPASGGGGGEGGVVRVGRKPFCQGLSHVLFYSNCRECAHNASLHNALFAEIL